MSRAARLATAWTLFLFAGFSTPGVPLPPVPWLSPDKAAHLVLFAVWAWLWVRALPGRPWTVAVWGAAFGVWIEVWQSVAPLGRMGDPFDAVADLVGVALGLGVAHAVGRRVGRRVGAPHLAGRPRLDAPVGRPDEHLGRHPDEKAVP